MPKQQSNVRERTRYKVPRMYEVVIFNDDVTTMEFVVEILMDVFRKSHAEAETLMLTVHHKGEAVAGVYTYDVARSKVLRATSQARAKGFPLKLTYRPEGTGN